LSSPLAVDDKGSGPPVVLVHGALGDYRQWTRIVELLKTEHRVLAVSRRFHWPNPPPSPSDVYSYESHRDDLLGWLRPMPDRVHLVGHSWGSGVALLAALSEPERIRTLTLIEPALASVVSEPAPTFDAENVGRAEMMAALQSFVRSGSYEDAARTLIDWVQGGPGGFSRLPETARRGLLANAATVGPTFAGAVPSVSRAELQALRLPTLVLSGERTRDWYQVVADAVTSAIPGAERGVIPAAGHMAIVENPDATAAQLLAFVGRH
jgi:pimeloyl-ACP methyl ester carboxylesterase